MMMISTFWMSVLIVFFFVVCLTGLLANELNGDQYLSLKPIVYLSNSSLQHKSQALPIQCTVLILILNRLQTLQ